MRPDRRFGSLGPAGGVAPGGPDLVSGRR